VTLTQHARHRHAATPALHGAGSARAARGVWRRCVALGASGLLWSLAGCRREPPRELAAPGAPVSAVAVAAAPSPSLRLLVLTDLSGVLEPCGCSARSLGGLDRLGQALRTLRSEVPHSMLVVAGATLFDPQREQDSSALPQQELWEAETLIDVLGELDAAAVLFSDGDLRLAGNHAQALVRRARFPILGARGARGLSGLRQRSDRAAGDLRVRIDAAALDGPSARAEPLPGPSAATTRALRVVLASGPPERVLGELALAPTDLVVLGGAPREQADGASVLLRGVSLHAGRQGEQLLVADIWWSDARSAFRAGRPRSATELRDNWLDVNLLQIAGSLPGDPAIRARLDGLTARIHDYNARSAEAPVARKGAPARFAGSAQCAACHTSAYLWWRGDAHGQAYSSLQRVHKEYNLDCIGCHVTGYGALGGPSLTNLGGLTDVGCESCHGAAIKHVEDPRHAARPLRSPDLEGCRVCHDAEHSPEFEPSRYAEKLRGPGHALSSSARR
jgi:hypothetical protein